MRVEDLLYANRGNHNRGVYFKGGYFSYALIYKKSIELSEVIKKMESNTVCLFLPNSINYVIAYFAILFAGKTIVPIHISAKILEIESTYKYCESDCIISDTKSIGMISEGIMAGNINIYDMEMKQYIGSSGHASLSASAKGLHWKNGRDDVVIMLHTSGTTSSPKRVMLTQQNIIENIFSHIATLELSSKDKTLIILPMCFGYCHITQFLTQVLLGGDIIISEGIFSAKSFFELIDKYQITYVTVVPTLMKIISDYRYTDRFNYSSLKYIFFGGSKVTSDLLEKMLIKFPNTHFFNTYGQTECGPRVTILNCRQNNNKINSVGIPIKGVEIKLVKEDYSIADSNEIGEIYVLSKSNMKGYFKQEKLTNITKEKGWIKTGDIGYTDEDGYLYLCGRKKNLIISCGINIYPEEIEEILLQNEYINEAVVFGVKDEIRGEKIVAHIVLKNSCEKNIIYDYCRKMLAPHKVPAEIVFREQLEKTTTGKIKRGISDE